MSYSIGFDIFAKDRASGTFDKLGGTVGRTESKFSKFSKVAAAGALVVGAAVVKFGADSVAAFTESETSQAKLTDAYARFPALADVNVEKLRAMNTELGKKTKFDDDATASGQAVLAGFKLTGTQLKDLTPLMQDYAAKTGKSLPEAAEVLGKAVMGNGKALKGIGLNLKDTGTATGNFDQLMGGLRKQVGGFAEKEGTTAAGKTAILGNQFGELQETVGSKLQPALVKLTDAGLKVVAWMSKNEGTVKVLGTALGVLVVGVGAIVGITKTYTAVQTALNVVMTMNPIGLVVLAIAALAAGLVLAYKKSDTFRAVVDKAFKAVGEAGKWLWNVVLQPVITSIVAGYGRVFTAIGTMLTALGHVPGFGWAKTAGEKMLTAGSAAQRLADNIKKIPDKTVTVTAFYKVSGSIQASQDARLGKAALRASGGPVRAGQPYIVGDGGRPELFVPDRNGTILPRVPSPSGPGGGGGTTINVNVSGQVYGSTTDLAATVLAGLQRIKGSGTQLGLA